MLKIFLGVLILLIISACTPVVTPAAIPPTVEVISSTLTKAPTATVTLPAPTSIMISQ